MREIYLNNKEIDKYQLSDLNLGDPFVYRLMGLSNTKKEKKFRSVDLVKI